jgi:hypothetical protein
MDRIDLPLISGDPSLDEVFDRMAESGVHAAIVAVAGREPVLVKNHDVSNGLEQGLQRVGQIAHFPLHVVNAGVEDWGSALDAAGSSYGTLADGGLSGGGPLERSGGADRDDDDDDGDGGGGAVVFEPREKVAMVTIVTRHETLAAEIRNAGAVCLCLNRHRVPGGRPCPICRKAVRCA